ncbi:MAG: alpha-amylase family glycosyl hydrolase [Planctomycetota bacterium]
MKRKLLSSVWILSLFIGLVDLEAQIGPGPSEIQIQQLQAGQWLYLTTSANDWNEDLTIELNVVSGNPDLYIRRGSLPTLTEWDFRPYLTPAVNKRSGFTTLLRPHERVVVNSDSTPAIETGTYFFGVHARTTCYFEVKASAGTLVSDIPGMGAVVHENGTTFRTWAPFADSVHLAGSFNGFNSQNAQMQPEGNGIFSIDIRGLEPGAEYKYVIRNANQTLWKNDARSKQLTNSVGNSVVANPNFNWTDQNFTMPNWNEVILYELHIGTINDEPGGLPSNFDDAIERLDEIHDLGVNAVQIMPIHEFPGEFSWGYNPSYPFSVESAYGGPEAMKRFVDAAHGLGMAVLLDVVHNHWGPTDLDLWRYDGFFEGIFGGIYFYQDERSFTPWGDTRPDFGRQEVRQYIRDNTLMWIDEYHIDGFRFDSTSNIRNTNLGENGDGWSLMQWINDEIDTVDQSVLCTAEDLQNNTYITKDTGAGGAGFDSQWTPSFVHPIRDVIVPPSDDGRNMWDVKSSLEQRYNGDAFQRIVYTESHDEVANGRSRVPEEIFPGNAGSYWSKKRSTLGAALVMTAPGIPMIFQGQELLEDEFFRDTDPVDWSRMETFSGIRQMYKDLIRLRRNWYNQTSGLRGQNLNVFHVNNSDKMVAFHRWQNGGSGDDVIVVCNFRNQPWGKYRIGFPRAGTWKVRFNSDWTGYSDDFDNTFSPDVTTINVPRDGLNYSGIIEIGPYSTIILSQD